MSNPAANGPRLGDTAVAAEPWRLSHMLALIVAAAVFFWAFTRIGVWAVVILLAFAIALGIGVAYIAVRDRSSQRHALLWMLAIAADHRMPMATTVDAFAGQYRGGFRRRVQRLARLLEDGTGLSHALRAVPGLATPESAMLVEIGEESGTPARALRSAADLQLERAAVARALASQAGYLGGVLLVVQGITAFVLYFIVPKFEAIFNDFGIALPGPTRAVIVASYALSRHLLIVLGPPVATVIAFLVLPRALTTGLAAAWLSRRKHAATILRALAMVAGANRPIEAGLRTLAARHPSIRIRRRLASAADDVRRGIDWREALSRRGLIRPAELDVLVAAGTMGNLAWAMTDLADAIDRRASLRRTLITQALWPAAIGAIGLLVMFLAIAFFLPLIKLIGSLSV